MKYLAIILASIVLVSCDTSGVKNTDKKDVKKSTKVTSGKDPVIRGPKTDIEKVHKVVNDKVIAGGIKIKWFVHGEGAAVSAGDMINIDYRVYDNKGKLFDGNHLVGAPSFPFMVGYGMQTKGWDIALQELKIGDFVEIYLPAEMARGEAGIEGLVDKNADNLVRIKILSKTKPTSEIDGTRVWLVNEEKSETNLFTGEKSILFHCRASTSSKGTYANTQWKNNPYRFKLNDSGLVPGLKKALINAKRADAIFVHVPAKEAYGSKGLQDLVKPNEDILYHVFVMDVNDK